MTFATPVWLLSLLPWAAVSVWFLRGRPRRQVVSFLPLWDAARPERATHRALRVPPLSLALMLIALLLALLAASGPVWTGGSVDSGPVTLIVDHGLTMSAGTAESADAKSRYAVLAESVQPRLIGIVGNAKLTLIDLPGGGRRETHLSHLAAAVATLPRTAVNVTTHLPAAVAQALRDAAGPVVVLTDAGLAFADPRVIVVHPDNAWSNAGIVSVTARQFPGLQVMVRLRNDAPARSATLRLRCGDATSDHLVDLPTGESTQFMNGPAAMTGDSIGVELLPGDALPADDHAWLVRGDDPPAIEVTGAVSAPLRRMIDVYARAHHATERSRHVTLATDLSQLKGNGPAVIVAAPPTGSGEPITAGPSLRVRDDPVTALVDWPGALRGGFGVGPPAGEWTPLVTDGPRVLVASRTTPARQVWIGFDSPQWSRSADYVVFWSNVLDWVGSGTETGGFKSEAARVLGDEWVMEAGTLPTGTPPALWPGIYRHADGRRIAINAPTPVPPRGINAADFDARSSRAFQRGPRPPATGRTPLSGELLLAAAAAVMTAALRWSTLQ